MRLLLFFLILIVMPIRANDKYKSEIIYSVYENKTHSTYAKLTVNASKDICMNMVADLISQFRGNPDQLFEWAFKGIGKQEGENNEKNEILLILKQATYDKKTEIGTLVVDVKVPGVQTYEDIHFTSKVSQYDLNKDKSVVDVDVFYSNSLLKKTYGTFFVESISNNKTRLSIEIHVRFGWFFNIFISQKRYKNLIEWRTDGFMNNLKQETERRVSKKKL